MTVIHSLFRLTLPLLSCHSANGSGRHTTKEWIERIIIAGFPSNPSQVAVGSTGLAFGYNAQARMLIVKKPVDNIAKDFTLTITL